MRRRAPGNLGLCAIGLLVTVGAGTGAASYAMAGVDPFYFTGSGARSSKPPSVSAAADGTTISSSSTFPSIAGDQYYYYGPPPVTASYDAVPPNAPAVVDRSSDRASRAESSGEDGGYVDAIDDQPMRGSDENDPAVKAVDAPGAVDGDALERDPPDPNY